ncbi:MAG: substrate-binding periplasmic protein [Shewanella sp.]|uniref:substrate-binding periplasmic protein n=1 Tax=Shewanella sp. TaxID=50422 RepID=UPI003F2CDAD8
MVGLTHRSMHSKMMAKLSFSTLLMAVLYSYPAAHGWAQVSNLCPQPLKVAYNDWAPYAFQGPKGVALGLDIEIMAQLAAELGCEVSFIYIPAKRSHQMLKQGTVDLMMGATQTPERQTYARFSDEYRDEEVKLFANAGSQDYRQLRQWEDLFTYKLRLLAPVAGWYGKDYEQFRARLAQAHLLILSPDLDKSVHMLAYGRGDVMIGDAAAVSYIAKRYPNIQLVPLNITLERSGIHLMLSQVSMGAAQLAAFNQAIHTLTRRGTIAHLQQKWQSSLHISSLQKDGDS